MAEEDAGTDRDIVARMAVMRRENCMTVNWSGLRSGFLLESIGLSGRY